MRLVCGEHGQLVSIELTPEEQYELLAFETNYAQLVPEKDGSLLDAIMLYYGIDRKEMRRFLDPPELSREDVWELQLLKREKHGDAKAIEAIRSLRSTETKLGVRILHTFVDRSKMLTRKGG